MRLSFLLTKFVYSDNIDAGHDGDEAGKHDLIDLIEWVVSRPTVDKKHRHTTDVMSRIVRCREKSIKFGEL